MATIVQDVKNELLTLRGKIDEAIAHVDSGVGNLNEGQVQRLGQMLDEIDGAAFDGRVRIERLFGGAVAVAGEAEQKAEQIAGAVETAAPSAADLDAVAEEQKAADATGAQEA